MGRNLGREFERLIEGTFEAYSSGGLARLMMMPVPTKQVGMLGRMPTLIRTGKSPFDVIGYLLRDATMIGAELKRSTRKKSLPIVGPGRKGDGLQFHQLDALAGLAQCAGIARLLWYNGGEVGVLTESGILDAWRVFQNAYKSEIHGRDVPRGAKSISWDRFVTIDYGNLYETVGLDWLQLTLEML